MFLCITSLFLYLLCVFTLLLLIKKAKMKTYQTAIRNLLRQVKLLTRFFYWIYFDMPNWQTQWKLGVIGKTLCSGCQGHCKIFSQRTDCVWKFIPTSLNPYKDIFSGIRQHLRNWEEKFGWESECYRATRGWLALGGVVLISDPLVGSAKASPDHSLYNLTLLFLCTTASFTFLTFLH